MNITQTVDIPVSRKLTIDVPPGVPVGRVVITFTPTEANGWVMPTAQCCGLKTPVIPDDIPEVEYPPEEIERLNRLRDVMETRFAAGELTTLEEYAGRRNLSGH